jgi:ubiquinone/menaquinone biosynthesis C-methylase UbiE
VDYPRALAEAHRVVKPGGRMVVVEFSHPTWPPFRRLYMSNRSKNRLKPRCLRIFS